MVPEVVSVCAKAGVSSRPSARREVPPPCGFERFGFTILTLVFIFVTLQVYGIVPWERATVNIEKVIEPIREKYLDTSRAIRKYVRLYERSGEANDDSLRS